MKVYKFELCVWLLFASIIVTAATLATIYSGSAWCLLAIFFIFGWDFEDVKRVRDTELLIEAAKVAKSGPGSTIF